MAAFLWCNLSKARATSRLLDYILSRRINRIFYRDELLNGEIFYTLREAQIVIESWRRHYNPAS